MTLLDTKSVAAIIARRVETYGATRLDVVVEYLGRLGVEPDRADEGVRFALIRGKVVRATNDDGEAILRRPVDWRAAA